MLDIDRETTLSIRRLPIKPLVRELAWPSTAHRRSSKCLPGVTKTLRWGDVVLAEVHTSGTIPPYSIIGTVPAECTGWSVGISSAYAECGDSCLRPCHVYTNQNNDTTLVQSPLCSSLGYSEQLVDVAFERAGPSQGAKYEYGTARLENREAILADIERVKPTHVLNCAGITGRPNVDWCEDHKVCLCSATCFLAFHCIGFWR